MLDNAEQISGPSLSQPEERRPKNDSVESVYLKNQIAKSSKRARFNREGFQKIIGLKLKIPYNLRQTAI